MPGVDAREGASLPGLVCWSEGAPPRTGRAAAPGAEPGLPLPHTALLRPQGSGQGDPTDVTWAGGVSSAAGSAAGSVISSCAPCVPRGAVGPLRRAPSWRGRGFTSLLWRGRADPDPLPDGSPSPRAHPPAGVSPAPDANPPASREVNARPRAANLLRSYAHIQPTSPCVRFPPGSRGAALTHPGVQLPPSLASSASPAPAALLCRSRAGPSPAAPRRGGMSPFPAHQHRPRTLLPPQIHPAPEQRGRGRSSGRSRCCSAPPHRFSGPRGATPGPKTPPLSVATTPPPISLPVPPPGRVCAAGRLAPPARGPGSPRGS